MDIEKQRQVYSIFRVEPLKASDSDLYVDLDPVRGENHIAQQIANKVLMDEKPSCQLLSGHKGSGKSTELYRAQKILEDKGYASVYASMEDEVDLCDVDFPEILIGIVRTLHTHLKEKESIDIKPGYFEDRLSEISKALGSKVDAGEVGIEVPFLKTKLAIKGSPDARRILREKLGPDTGNLQKAANDMIGEAIVKLNKKGKQGLVIIVDDLDKLLTVRLPDDRCTTSEYLFIQRFPQMAGFGCHMIYTMPLDLLYSHSQGIIEGKYGGAIPTVGMTKVWERPPKTGPYECGIAKFEEVINKRLIHCGMKKKSVFADDSVWKELIVKSGGQPSELMAFIRSSMARSGLPITEEAVKETVSKSSMAYHRWIREEHIPLLKEVAKKGTLEKNELNERYVRDLLHSRAVLLYRNSSEWYGVNPVIDMSRFK